MPGFYASAAYLYGLDLTPKPERIGCPGTESDAFRCANIWQFGVINDQSASVELDTGDRVKGDRVKSERSNR